MYTCTHDDCNVHYNDYNVHSITNKQFELFAHYSIFNILLQ